VCVCVCVCVRAHAREKREREREREGERRYFRVRNIVKRLFEDFVTVNLNTKWRKILNEDYLTPMLLAWDC